MHLDYKQLPEKSFDFVWTVWASCRCEKFSIAPCQLFSKEEREARAEEGSILARRTKEIIDWLKPRWVAIENPGSPALWKQNLFDYNKVKLSYCMYGFKYRKNTTIATNISVKGKVCRGDCGFVRQVRDAERKIHFHHEEVAKQGISAHCRGLGVQCTTHKRDALYAIPPALVRDILNAALHK
jgi:hypothetical protein